MTKTPLILLLTSLVLTSCQSKKIDRQIYQPRVLIIPPNSRIETTEGWYLSDPNVVERWFSAQKVEELEKIISNL
jgi:hypothetical protein